MPGMIKYEDNAEVILIDVDKISSIKERLSGKHPGANDFLLIYCGEHRPITIECNLIIFTDLLKKAKKAKTFEYYSLKSGKVVK